MPKPLERRSNADEKNKTLPKPSEDTTKLAWLRAEHGLTVFDLQRQKQQQELQDKVRGGWEPFHSDPEKSRPQWRLRGGMEGEQSEKRITPEDVRQAKDALVASIRYGDSDSYPIDYDTAVGFAEVATNPNDRLERMFGHKGHEELFDILIKDFHNYKGEGRRYSGNDIRVYLRQNSLPQEKLPAMKKNNAFFQNLSPTHRKSISAALNSSTYFK